MTAETSVLDATLDAVLLPTANMTEVAPDKAFIALCLLVLEKLVQFALDSGVPFLQLVQHC